MVINDIKASQKILILIQLPQNWHLSCNIASVSVHVMDIVYLVDLRCSTCRVVVTGEISEALRLMWVCVRIWCRVAYFCLAGSLQSTVRLRGVYDVSLGYV